jgi:hypothetical protein
MIGRKDIKIKEKKEGKNEIKEGKKRKKKRKTNSYLELRFEQFERDASP